MRLSKLIAAFVITFAAGAIGNLTTGDNISTWYAGLDKPFFTPPNAVFGPVWTLLYTLIAVSLYLIWSRGVPRGNRAYWWFAFQLTLNTLWSIVFFGAHQLWLGVAVIAGLIVAIIGTMRAFWPISCAAVYLLAPYLAWVLFATALNISIATLNT